MGKRFVNLDLLRRVGLRVLFFRCQRGLSRGELALALGVPERALQAWELGERDPGIVALFHLAEALGVASCELLEPFGPGEEPIPRRGRPPLIG
jgi:transcriptional regulator with XRE-family HTH domain